MRKIITILWLKNFADMGLVKRSTRIHKCCTIRPGTGVTLKEGLTFTIEPMINQGKRHTRILSDGCIAVTKAENYLAVGTHRIGYPNRI